MDSKKLFPVSAKFREILTNFFLNFADRTENPTLPLLAEPDRGSYLVFQIVRVGGF